MPWYYPWWRNPPCIEPWCGYEEWQWAIRQPGICSINRRCFSWMEV